MAAGYGDDFTVLAFVRNLVGVTLKHDNTEFDDIASQFEVTSDKGRD